MAGNSDMMLLMYFLSRLCFKSLATSGREIELDFRRMFLPAEAKVGEFFSLVTPLEATPPMLEDTENGFALELALLEADAVESRAGDFTCCGCWEGLLRSRAVRLGIFRVLILT